VDSTESSKKSSFLSRVRGQLAATVKVENASFHRGLDEHPLSFGCTVQLIPDQNKK